MWVLPIGEYRKLDYFHGQVGPHIIAQDDPDEVDWYDSELLSHRGLVVKAISKL